MSSHRVALRYAEQGNDRVAEARLLIQLGSLHTQLTQFETAAQLIRRALGMFRRACHRTGSGWALNQLGVTLREMGRWHFALACHQWSFDLFNEVNDNYAGSALHNIAAIYRKLGQLDSAAEMHRQGVADCRQLGNRLHQGRSLNALGVVYRELGRTAEAMDCHRENLAICREFHDFHGEARTLANLAAAYRDTGVLDEAIDHHLQAVRMFQQVGHRYREGLEYKELGLTFRMAGQEADAARCLTRALEILDDFPGADAVSVQETRAALGE